MQANKVNILLDQAFGSSGKGKFAAVLADLHRCRCLSSSNYPNAGHTVVLGGEKFVAKAIPTAAFLNAHRVYDGPMECFISPGSGFGWEQLFREWTQCAYPILYIHGMVSIVTADHRDREHHGEGSTTHIGSTRQGTSAAMIDKLLRKPDCLLARTFDTTTLRELAVEGGFVPADAPLDRINILDGPDFRDLVWARTFGHKSTDQGMFLHEGSQGYALSIDHGAAPHYGTSRNCTSMKALDDLGMPPRSVGDIYMNIRTFPIRVGHITDESGKVVGNSGPFYPDSEEITWEQVAADAGMPDDEVARLLQREHTTVTGRLRRVSTFSWQGLRDAVRTNGATKLIVNFAQYLDWADHGVRSADKLSKRTQVFIEQVEYQTNRPVVMVGTGADHGDVVHRL